jgi:uncharacterized protein with beta-barrel porin domain
LFTISGISAEEHEIITEETTRTDYWSGASGSWTDPTLWSDTEDDSGGDFPGANTDANVTIDGHEITRNDSAEIAINSLTIRNSGTDIGTLNISGGALNVNSVTNYGAMDVRDTATLTATTIGNKRGASLYFTDFEGTFAADTLKNSGMVSINRSTVGFGNVTNKAAGMIALENSTAIFHGAINNINGVLALNRSTATFNADTSNTVTGTIELSNGSTIDGEGTLLPGNGHLFRISDSGNIIAVNINLMDENGTLKISGTDSDTDEVTIHGEITSGGNPVKFDFQNVNVVFGENVLNSLADIAIANGTTFGGYGNTGTNFVFENGSFHNPGNSPGTFHANNITYNSGSVIYIEAGSNWDQVIAENDIKFSGDVTIYLLNGNLNGQAKQDVFVADGNLLLGNDNLNQNMVGAVDVDNNTVEIENSNSDKITIQSMKWNGNDSLIINGVTATDKTLGFDVTTTATTGGTAGTTGYPMNLQPNVATLFGVVTDSSMSSTGLALELADYHRGDLDKMYAAIAQLDPVALSLGGRITHDAVSRFNRLNFARLQRYQDADRFQFVPLNRFEGMTVRGQSRNISAYGGKSVYGSDSGGLWFESLGSIVNQDDRDGIAGYSSNTVGFGVGLDGRLSENFVAGFGFGGLFTQADVEHYLGRNSVDNYIVSLFGCLNEGGLTVSLAGGYACSSLKSTRMASLIDGYAHGSRSANTTYGSVEISYRFGCSKRYFSPFYAMDFISYQEDAYEETGHLINMQVDSRYVTGYLQTAGVRIGTRWQQDNGWVFNPELTLGWIHDYGDGSITTSGQFVQGGTPFTVIGTSRNKDRALVGFGLATIISPQFTTFARYDGELAEKFNNRTVQAGFNLTF